MKYIYSLKEWKTYVRSAIRNVAVGLFRIAWSMVIAVLSTSHHAGKSIRDFHYREPKASQIVVCLFLFIMAGWLLTFAYEHSCRVKAETQRDKLLLRLDSARQRSGVIEYPHTFLGGFNNGNTN